MELRKATASEIVARRCLTFSSWGGKLSLEQYLDREKSLAEHEFVESMITWVLAEGDDLLASCETYPMRSILRDQDEMHVGVTWAVATVYVDPKLRNQGHASELLEQVLAELRTQEDVHSSILFSEVGTPIYERLGYVSRPATSRIYTPPTEVGDELVADPIAFEEVPEVLESRDYTPRHVFRVEATPVQIDWHFTRSRFYARTLKREPESQAGARAAESWALWAPNYKTDRLDILALAPGLGNGTRAVLEAARRRAKALGLKQVSVWENPDNVDSLVGGESVERQANVPMILPLHDGFKAQDWTDYERGLWV